MGSRLVDRPGAPALLRRSRQKGPQCPLGPGKPGLGLDLVAWQSTFPLKSPVRAPPRPLRPNSVAWEATKGHGDLGGRKSPAHPTRLEHHVLRAEAERPGSTHPSVIRNTAGSDRRLSPWIWRDVDTATIPQPEFVTRHVPPAAFRNASCSRARASVPAARSPGRNHTPCDNRCDGNGPGDPDREANRLLLRRARGDRQGQGGLGRRARRRIPSARSSTTRA